MGSKKKVDKESSETNIDTTELENDQNNESDADPTTLSKEDDK